LAAVLETFSSKDPSEECVIVDASTPKRLTLLDVPCGRSEKDGKVHPKKNAYQLQIEAEVIIGSGLVTCRHLQEFLGGVGVRASAAQSCASDHPTRHGSQTNQIRIRRRGSLDRLPSPYLATLTGMLPISRDSAVDWSDNGRTSFQPSSLLSLRSRRSASG